MYSNIRGLTVFNTSTVGTCTGTSDKFSSQSCISSISVLKYVSKFCCPSLQLIHRNFPPPFFIHRIYPSILLHFCSSLPFSYFQMSNILRGNKNFLLLLLLLLLHPIWPGGVFIAQEKPTYQT